MPAWWNLNFPPGLAYTLADRLGCRLGRRFNLRLRRSNLHLVEDARDNLLIRRGIHIDMVRHQKCLKNWPHSAFPFSVRSKSLGDFTSLIRPEKKYSFLLPQH